MSNHRTQPMQSEIAALKTLSAPALRARWATLLGRPAPRRVSRAVLSRAIAWELQAAVYGGLKSAVLRRLQGLAAPASHREGQQRRVSTLTPGTRLLRDWHGEVQTVEVLPDGYGWRGQRYRSLSVIARTITGTRVSGPRFFGLTKGPRGRRA